MITQKNISRFDITLSQTFPVKEIQKKKRLRARNARFSGAENTRARTREPAEMAMMTIHIIIRLDMI